MDAILPKPVFRLFSFRRLAFFALVQSLLLVGALQAQNAGNQTLEEAYKHIQHPEITLQQFIEINQHALSARYNKTTVGARSQAVAAPQDTYCSNVRTYCSNGDFESGLDQAQWTGAYGFDYTGVTPNPFSLTYRYGAGSIYSSSSHQTIVNKTDGNDPYVSIPQVASNGGTKALRLGNAVNGNGTEVLAKTIVIDSNETILNFYYAVVFEDPGHSYNDQPAFSVRVYDCATGNEITGVCNLGNNSNVVVSNASNPFFQSAYSGSIAYRDWSLAQINLSSHIGKKVTIIFETKDCNLGGHFGYAYLDNIFSNLCPIGGLILTGQGSISLNSATTSTCGVGQICAKYTLPSSNTTTGSTNITLDIYQSGSKVTSLTSGTLTRDTSYCFNINPASLGLNTALGAFDYVLTGNFILNGFTLSPIVVGSPPNGQVSGSNNDYLISCALPTVYYSKSAGDLSNLSTWGTNPDGSGTAPADFGAGKTFNLANRSGIYTLTNNWTVAGIINNPSGSQLQINGLTLSEAGISGTGTLTGSMTSNLVVTGTASGDTGRLNFTTGAGMLGQLTINRIGAAATLGTTPLSIYDVLTISSGILNTDNVLTLKSTATNTARVAPVTGTISGTVTVERYIPARRAWRIMSAPIAGSQTINQAWQEGATSTTANLVPNYGTFITGGSVADGFDQSQNATSSLKIYNSASGWQPVPNTNATAVNGAAYILFGYGNRNNVTIPVSQPATNTTLRVMGPLKTGDQFFPVSPTGFTAVPNPFASPINFATITKTGVANSFYVWDPKVGGTNGVGAYVTISFNGSTYDVSSNAISPESQYIQSGQGFLVYPSASGTAGSITIKESDKSNTAATNVFRSSGTNTNTSYGGLVFQDPTKGQGLRMSLQVVNGERTNAVLDEIFSSYKADYSNKIDELDAAKPANIAENLGIERAGQILSIERRMLPVSRDTIKLKLWNTTDKQYLLEINPINLSSTGLYAYLKDSYMKTLTAISLDKITQTFFITDNAAAARSDRFSVILSKNNKLQNEIEASQENVITAFPNPIVGKIVNLQFSHQPSGTYRITIASSSGKTMLEKSIQYNAGMPVVSFELDKKLSSGIYQVRIIGKSVESACKILVQ